MRRQVRDYLDQQLAAAPRRGKGARRRSFIANTMTVAERYEKGLYHCYDDPRICHTTNDLEGQHGTLKHHLRKVTGRASTSGGPVETAGEFLAGALDAVKRHGTQAAVADLLNVDPAAYIEAREELSRVMEPARQYRSIQRKPDENLESIERDWDAAAQASV